MSAYVLNQVEVTDPVAMQVYIRSVAATVAAYGGEYLVRNGATETVEGDCVPKGLIILKFASVARAKEWLNSPEYAPLKQIRHILCHAQPDDYCRRCPVIDLADPSHAHRATNM